jgi:hypothetical protein
VSLSQEAESTTATVSSQLTAEMESMTAQLNDAAARLKRGDVLVDAANRLADARAAEVAALTDKLAAATSTGASAQRYARATIPFMHPPPPSSLLQAQPSPLSPTLATSPFISRCRAWLCRSVEGDGASLKERELTAMLCEERQRRDALTQQLTAMDAAVETAWATIRHLQQQLTTVHATMASQRSASASELYRDHSDDVTDMRHRSLDDSLDGDVSVAAAGRASSSERGGYGSGAVVETTSASGVGSGSSGAPRAVARLPAVHGVTVDGEAAEPSRWQLDADMADVLTTLQSLRDDVMVRSHARGVISRVNVSVCCVMSNAGLAATLSPPRALVAVPVGAVCRVCLCVPLSDCVSAPRLFLSVPLTVLLRTAGVSCGLQASLNVVVGAAAAVTGVAGADAAATVDVEEAAQQLQRVAQLTESVFSSFDKLKRILQKRCVSVTWVALTLSLVVHSHLTPAAFCFRVSHHTITTATRSQLSALLPPRCPASSGSDPPTRRLTHITSLFTPHDITPHHTT